MSSKNPRLKKSTSHRPDYHTIRGKLICPSSFETRSLPNSLAAAPQLNASPARTYVAFPKSSIRPAVLRIYVARVPAAPFHHFRIAGDTPAATDLRELRGIVGFEQAAAHIAELAHGDAPRHSVW